jgi:cytochrome-b5 reductase
VASRFSVIIIIQILNHALSQKDNKTRFKLIFANVEERDILLREEFDAMKKEYPDTFDYVLTLDKPGKNWHGKRLTSTTACS